MNPKDYIVYEKNIEARGANYSIYPKDLLPEIKDYLIKNGINQLYSHQAEMFESAIKGNNIVITTSTASGKTLSFLLPVLQEILKNPSTRAIFVYPTKALASDQYRAIKPFLDYFCKDRIYAGVYDGDTPVNERSVLRKKANIILTNPEMLNGAFLPNHSSYGFDYIFKNLKFVVFDELHTYRGAFGSHISNIMRRLSRICKYYNSAPQILCSSATIANPIELAENIFNKKFILINKDGSPASNKNYYIIQPPLIKDTNFQIPTKDLVEPLILNLAMHNSNFIAFCESRQEVEIIVKETREQLKSEQIFGEDKSDLVSGYRGGYLPQERKEIEKKMINGQIVGLVSTNALELGIDIGKVGTTILNGFPSTRASFWQQSGRAGRKGNNADTYLILKQKPIDQYIASYPEWLFNTESENAVVDKNNLFIQLAHCRSAAAELPLDLDDISLFPNLSEILPVLISHNEIKQINGKFVWSGSSFPAGDYSLRNVDNERYKVINIETETVLTEVDKYQAYTQLYKGAIYMHDAITYEVIELNINDKTIKVKESHANYYTEPLVGVEIEILNIFKTQLYNKTQYKFADLKVKTYIKGFKKVQFRNSQNLGWINLDTTLTLEMETEGVLLQIPKEIVEQLPKIPDMIYLKDDCSDIYKEIAFTLETSSQMITMTSVNDIGSAKTIDENKDEYICLYDKYQGGLGFSEKIFNLMPQVIDNAIKMIKGCRCEIGCPACIGTNNPDKSIVLWALENLTKESKRPEFIQKEREKRLILTKEFKLETLVECWEEFKGKFVASGEYLSSFISNVEKIQVEKSNLILFVKDYFTKSWIENENNLKQLSNALLYYIETPKEFSISIETESQENNDLERKINKRYKEMLKKTDEN